VNYPQLFISSLIGILLIFCFPDHVLGQQRYHFSGVVTDQAGESISQATVVLLPDRQTAITDAKGRFSFSKLYEGTYQVQISCIGYHAAESSIQIEQADISHFKQVLTPNQTALSEVAVNGHIPSVDNLLRSEQSAMPVTVITRRQIELMGSRRLDEVMKEQTGVAVVNDITGGSRAIGVQIQGFSSNYVMVLVDGQPMLGRNNGNFDLSRISVTNIERIEIIKGASSCLYGSDALGGAINIITRHGAIAPQAHASLLYGTLNIVDATLEGETPFANQRGSVVLSGNYYRTDGFNTDKKFLTNSSSTVSPYENYSFQGRTRYRTSKNGTLGFTARYAARNSKMINAWSDDMAIEDRQKDQDLNLSGSYDHSFDSGIRSMTRYYFTRFHTAMQAQWLRQGFLAGAEEFGQQVHRLEQQFAYSPQHTLKFTGGIGGSIERMDNQELDQKRSLNTAFAYLQTEWSPVDRVQTTLGLRYDYTNVYDSRLSPSFGLQYQLSPTLLAKAGIGAGFKAPDYKMRYQVFYNPAANYLVVGSDRIADVIHAMEASGELSSKNTYMVNLVSGNLKAEKSLSNNIGLVWKPNSKWQTELSAFYHRIHNQINTISVASGTTIEQIYSYRNLPKAVNKGFEVSATYQATADLQLSAGYQYLIAKDLSVLDSIRADKWPYNIPIINPVTGEDHLPTTRDYWGIEDRSRHMVNLKALYEYRPWQLNFNLRANIRGKYPFQETTTNQFIDKYDEFVPDHVLLNLTIEKSLWNRKLTLRIVADNLLNFTHRNMLGQPGRVILGGISYRWMKE